jgi:hypothetical protein
MPNIAYATFKNPNAGSGPGGSVQCEYMILASDNSVVVTTGIAAVIVNYGDTNKTIKNAMVAEIQLNHSDPYLQVQFIKD